ncbi:hypothetical protein AURDEDRAFT_82898 [Auricularia subglabra TFB-10046 SS5]|nr:hypothetical protein AURDEDRAFT_82898 [Auricularia subglabra TFB-10046 SS5]
MATMADICADPGVGRLSTRYAAVQESFATEKQRRKERRSEMHARAMKRLYGEPVDGEPSSSVHIKLSLKETEGDDEAGKGDEFDYDQAVNVSGHHAAQVRIGPNGEVIIDEESLQVDRAAAPEHQVDEDAMVHIEENDLTRFVNQATYSRKVAGARWTKEETELFYHALQQFGSDFTSIALMLGTRPRNQVKQKFNREDKINPERITWALKNRIPIDIETLSKKTGKSFDGPVPQYGPTEAQLAEAAARATPAASSRKHTPASNRDPSEAPSAASAGKKGGRKRGNALPEGLEVLGSIDDYIDKDDD